MSTADVAARLAGAVTGEAGAETAGHGGADEGGGARDGAPGAGGVSESTRFAVVGAWLVPRLRCVSQGDVVDTTHSRASALLQSQHHFARYRIPSSNPRNVSGYI